MQLDSKYNRVYNLNYCEHFDPLVDDDHNAKYELVTLSDCEKTWSDDKKTVDIVVLSTELDKNSKEYLIVSKDGLENDLECKALYTDDGYPVLPYSVRGARALNFQLSDLTELNDISKDYGIDFSDLKFELHDSYLSKGSVIFVPRGNGESSQYVVMHEFGHSLGLTDVIQSDLFTINNVYYASSETNVMSWREPSGNKLRYRDIPIACSGGNLYKDITGKNLGSTEHLIPGNFEKQWECIRGKCFKSEYSSGYPTDEIPMEFRYNFFNTSAFNYNLGFSNTARKDYWKNEGECASKKLTLNGKTQEQYKKDYREDMKGKYEPYSSSSTQSSSSS